MNQAETIPDFLVSLSCFLLLSILSTSEVGRSIFQSSSPSEGGSREGLRLSTASFRDVSREVGGISLLRGGVEFSLCFPSCNRFERDSFVTLLFA